MLSPYLQGYMHKEAETPEQRRYRLINLARAVYEHEGVKGNKSPFMITSPEMRKWKTFLGYPVIAPPEGSNFIHFKNPEDIVPAIAKQLKRYSDNPLRYGLKNNPTVRDALRVFDQTKDKRFDGKLKYVNKSYPRRKLTTMPLKFFTSGNSLGY